MFEKNFEQNSYEVLRELLPPDEVYDFIGIVLRYFATIDSIEQLESTQLEFDPGHLLKVLEEYIEERDEELRELARTYIERMIEIDSQ